MEQDIDDQVRAAAFADAPNGSSNGSPNGHAAASRAQVPVGSGVAPSTVHSAAEVQTAAVQAVLADKMGDAPLCDTCGHITVRNGSCYRCLNCGESKGCS